MRKAPGPKIEGSRILHIVTCENQASTEQPLLNELHTGQLFSI
jgi:hypothetical protein